MLPGRPDCGKAPGSVDGATLAGSGCCAMLTVTVGLGKHPDRVDTKPPGPVMGTPTTGY